MLKSRIPKLAVAAFTITSALGLTSMGAQAVGATGGGHTSAVAAQTHATVRPDGAYDNCASGTYCDFTGTNGSNLCFGANYSISDWNITSPPPINCENKDESFANRTSGLVRLYAETNFNGAWVCIDASKYSNDLSGYRFNNGSGKPGYHALLENDVESSQIGSGSCSNPLPWP